MYKYNDIRKGSIKVNNSFEGERIENKVYRITKNNEPIKDGAPIIYTERKEGVLAGYNIRTDRFEVALDAMDAVNKSIRAKREEKADLRVVKNDDGGAESIQGTN